MLTKKRISIVILSLIFVLSLGIFGISTLGTAKAEADTTFQMESGAYVRKSTNYEGLQFGAKVGADLVAEVEADANKSFGGLIFPVDLFGEVDKTSSDVVNALIDGGKENLVNLYSKNGLIPTDFGNDEYYVYLTISNLYYSNINRDYFGIIYIYDSANGTYTYASYVAAENEANAAEVAAAGLAVAEIGAEDKELFTKYVKKGSILDANPDISEATFNLEYEAYDFKAYTIPSGESMFDYETLHKVENAYNALSDDAKEYVADNYATLTTALETHSAKYLRVTSIDSQDGDIIYSSGEDETKTNANNTKGYDKSVTKGREVDSEYGFVVQTATLTGGTGDKNGAFDFTDETMTAVSTALSENEGATAQFYIKTSTGKSLWFGTSAAPYCGDRETGAALTSTTANVWLKITFTAEEWADFNGKISRTSFGDEITISITNIYIVKDVPVVVPEYVDITANETLTKYKYSDGYDADVAGSYVAEGDDFAYARATITKSAAGKTRSFVDATSIKAAINSIFEEYDTVTEVYLMMRTSVGGGDRVVYFRNLDNGGTAFETAKGAVKTAWTAVKITKTNLDKWCGYFYLSGGNDTFGDSHTIDIGRIYIGTAPAAYPVA